MSKSKRVKVGKRFLLKRVIDDSGVSGTGYVAMGIVWPSGKVTIEWIVGEHISQEYHETLEDCMAIHGHGDHTIVEWIDRLNTRKI
jgi:hypothetical protein